MLDVLFTIFISLCFYGVFGMITYMAVTIHQMYVHDDDEDPALEFGVFWPLTLPYLIIISAPRIGRAMIRLPFTFKLSIRRWYTELKKL